MIQLQTDPLLKEKEQNLQIAYGTAASEAMFDFPCYFFQAPDCTGAIPYRLEYDCAIIFGEPLCPQEEKKRLTEAFHQFCRQSNYHIIYILVSENFAKNIAGDHCSILIESCKELIFDPHYDPCQSSSRLRHRVAKAVRHGLTFHEYLPSDPETEKALKEIGVQWQKAIKGPHIYLGHLNFFETYAGKRWFYVKEGSQITSMVMLSRLEAQDGWFLKFLITKPHTFHDTSEFLMTSLLETLRKEDCRYLSKGMLPADRLGEIRGLNSFAKWNVETIFRTVSWICKFKKRKEYWLRYNPHIARSYVLFSHPSIGINEMKALTKVFKTSTLSR